MKSGRAFVLSKVLSVWETHHFSSLSFSLLLLFLLSCSFYTTPLPLWHEISFYRFLRFAYFIILMAREKTSKSFRERSVCLFRFVLLFFTFHWMALWLCSKWRDSLEGNGEEISGCVRVYCLCVNMWMCFRKEKVLKKCERKKSEGK